MSDLARVEGEGALRVRIRGGRVESLALEVFEPSRWFEALLRGRTHLEPVDIAARICGICPVAHQATAARAIQAACGAAGRRGQRLHGGAESPALPLLPARRAGPDPRGDDRPPTSQNQLAIEAQS